MIRVDLSTLTEEQRDEFVDGWMSVGGYVGDMDSPSPWCFPWYWCEDFVTFEGSTPYEWGIEWLKEWEGQIKSELWYEFEEEEDVK